jgi:transcriptional regulator GlxA family with amidase domain
MNVNTTMFRFVLAVWSKDYEVQIKIRLTEEYLQQHFDCDISIDNLVKQAGMGPRNFIRRFKAATGRVPGAYLQTLRVSATKEMLEYGTVDPGG